jgi:ABC-type uncharacterized transport system permease subunit
MKILKELLPVSAILIVIFAMSGVDIFILGEPERIVSSIPMIIILILWLFATCRIGRE